MKFLEIKNLLLEKRIRPYTFFQYHEQHHDAELDDLLKVLEVTGEIEIVSDKGCNGAFTNEWGLCPAELIFLFVNHDVYIRIEGEYSSYEGVVFNHAEYEEVRPVQKTITVYEKNI